MHAIAEEAHSKENSIGHVSNGAGSRKNLRRRNSRVSNSGDEKSKNPSIGKDKPIFYNGPKISINTSSNEDLNVKEFTLSLKKPLVLENLEINNENASHTFNLNSSKHKKLMQLPIITHTCPTPVHTPSTSSRNSPLFSNYKFLYGSKYFFKDRNMIRYYRKYSLDSANDRIKVFF